MKIVIFSFLFVVKKGFHFYVSCYLRILKCTLAADNVSYICIVSFELLININVDKLTTCFWPLTLSIRFFLTHHFSACTDLQLGILSRASSHVASEVICYMCNIKIFVKVIHIESYITLKIS